MIQLNSHDGEEREHSFSCIACCKLSDTQSEYELYKRTLRGTMKIKLYTKRLKTVRSLGNPKIAE